jgi:hypothetical protein
MFESRSNTGEGCRAEAAAIMAATYPNIHAGPVEAYLSIYLGFVVVYAIIYVKQRRVCSLTMRRR